MASPPWRWPHSTRSTLPYISSNEIHRDRSRADRRHGSIRVGTANDDKTRCVHRRTIRSPRARVRPEGIPEQDLACFEFPRGCESATRADAGVLRMLRLAFIGARPLAAGTLDPRVSQCAIRNRCARGTQGEHHSSSHRRRSCVFECHRTRVVRTSLWFGLAAAARCRAARITDA